MKSRLLKRKENHTVLFYLHCREIQYLVPQQFVYYTWTNPTKSRELSIANNDKTKSIKLNVI